MLKVPRLIDIGPEPEKRTVVGRQMQKIVFATLQSDYDNGFTSKELWEWLGTSAV